MAKQIEHKHPLAIRWLHWVNFPLLAMMIWSGLLIYWANPVYSIWIGHYELFSFFPAWFNEALGIPYHLAEGLQLHFFFMWLFAANGVAYILYLAFSGEWRALLPIPSSFKRAGLVALHDAHLVKTKPPQGKYNDAQRIAYTGVIVMGALSVLTGLAIYKPLQLAWLTAVFGGYQWARFVHFWLTILFVSFFVVHIVQVAIAGWSNFRAMITGRDVRATAAAVSSTDALVDEVRDLAVAGDRNNTSLILAEKLVLSEPMEDGVAKRELSRYSRRGFLVGGASAVIGVLGWRWMPVETKANILRSTLEFNERVSQVFYRPSRLEREFPSSAISPPRINGDLGLKSDFELASWRLRVVGLWGRPPEIELTLDDIKALPRTEMTTELKCIEGWSIVVKWAGVRFSDFVAKYNPVGGASYTLHGNRQNQPPYIALATPDEQYFVGWDIESMLHPQTLLVYEMNGEPLLPEHGAPLRLASPTKYGIKLIKRIGRIEFTWERPRDYWAESGYDWYSGH